MVTGHQAKVAAPLPVQRAGGRRRPRRCRRGYGIFVVNFVVSVVVLVLVIVVVLVLVIVVVVLAIEADQVQMRAAAAEMTELGRWKRNGWQRIRENNGWNN